MYWGFIMVALRRTDSKGKENAIRNYYLKIFFKTAISVGCTSFLWILLLFTPFQKWPSGLPPIS